MDPREQGTPPGLLNARAAKRIRKADINICGEGRAESVGFSQGSWAAVDAPPWMRSQKRLGSWGLITFLTRHSVPEGHGGGYIYIYIYSFC